MCKPSMIAAVALVVASPVLAQDQASAKFASANGVEVGTVQITQTDQGLAFEGTLTTVIPGEHGLHLYSAGDCEGANEFNLGGAESTEIGRVNADGQGNVEVDLTSDVFSLVEAEQNYVLDEDGSALILDNGADDPTAPATSSGEPVLCALVEATPAE